jgi:hypothetical protein
MTKDVYGYLFPSGNREWVGKLKKIGWEANPSTLPHPKEVGSEQPTHKSLALFGGGEPQQILFWPENPCPTERDADGIQAQQQQEIMSAC